MEELWSFEHSIECPVPRPFAWQFWTRIDTWRLDADVESVELNGPFAPGSRGATITRSSGRMEWGIAAVQPEVSALIEVTSPGGIGRFHWTFDDAGRATRITQRVSICAEQASPLVDMIAHALEEGIPAGMKKLCAAMAAASQPQPAPPQPASS